VDGQHAKVRKCLREKPPEPNAASIVRNKQTDPDPQHKKTLVKTCLAKSVEYIAPFLPKSSQPSPQSTLALQKQKRKKIQKKEMRNEKKTQL
jgi:hypothetical protein